MNTLDTRDLIEERTENQQRILDDWNEKFEENQLDSYEDVLTEAQTEFLEYWDDEIKEIEDVNNLEDEINNGEFEFGTTLIEEDDFEEFCEEELEQCGYISRDFPIWIVIDWKETASNMQQDYSEVEFRGTTYLYR